MTREKIQTRYENECDRLYSMYKPEVDASFENMENLRTALLHALWDRNNALKGVK